MYTLTSGQSSQSEIAGDDRGPQLARAWFEIPPDVLWRWVVSQVAEHSLRGVQQLVGLSKETIRKYVNRSAAPNVSTRKALGELFLRHHPGGAMPEPCDDGDPSAEVKLRPQLIDLLPAGEEKALEALRDIFEIARRFPKLVPKTVREIERWMELQVRGEYEAERFYTHFPRRARMPRGEARRSRPRPRAPDGEVDERPGGESSGVARAALVP